MRIVTSIVSFLISFSAISQDNGNPFEIDYSGEVVKIAKATEAPEASYFTKYGNTPVSLYTGTPNISIPLHTYTGREMDLSFSLSYDAQGIKVEQQASWIGLGWNLMAGGRIVRVINGLPDDYINSDYQTVFDEQLRNEILRYRDVNNGFNSELEVRNYFTFLDRADKNFKDIAQDYFTVTAPGLNETVVIDLETMKGVSLSNPNTKVNYSYNNYITSWTIIKDDGTKYIFAAQEKTDVQGNDINSVGGILKEYVSSWLLSRIESPLKKDIYTFNYVNSGYWQQPFSASPASHVSNIMPRLPGGRNVSGPDKSTTFQPATRLDQLFLNNINHNGSQIAFFGRKRRFDLHLDTPAAISEIEFYAPLENALVPLTKSTLNPRLKMIVFDHSYFGTTATNPGKGAEDDIRLKLDRVHIRGSSIVNEQKYTMDYNNPEEMPSKKSLSQDYLGFYNGAFNQVLYPKIERRGDTYQGASRKLNFDRTVTGILEKITYPTGGYTLFEYESHNVPSQLEDQYEIRDVTKGTASISGGEDLSNIDVCGNYCVDKFIKPPRIGSSVFNLTEEGAYKIDFRSSGISEAYLFEHPSSSGFENSSFNNSNPVRYNELIDQNNGGQNFPYIWNGHGGDTRRQITLQPGKYQLTVVNGTVGEETYLRIHRDERVLVFRPNENIVKAGVRIKKIIDYDNNSAKVKEKNYRYTTTTTDQTSSGKVLFEPQLSYITSTTNPFFEPPLTENTLHRLSGVQSNQPHVVYNRVYEYDTTLVANGYTRYDFNADESGLVTSATRPYVTSYIPDYKVGKEKDKSIFKESGIVYRQKSLFADYPYFSASGLFIRPDEGNTYKYVHIRRDDSTGKFIYELLSAVNFGGGPAPPQICFDSPGTCLSARPDFATLTLRRTLMRGQTGHIKETKTTVFEENEGQTTTQLWSYSDNDHLLSSYTIVNSDQKTVRTEYSYAKDFSGSVYEGMINRNRVNEVLAFQGYKNTEKTNAKRYVMKLDKNQVAVPNLIQSTKANGNMESRIVYHKFDNFSNPIEISQIDGVRTLLVWGYRNQYPILKIENATFEGMPDDINSLLEQIRNLSNSENNGLEEKELIQLTDELKNQEYFRNSRVTSYTYNPQIGITSQTDPKGYTMYYHYDDFNRLEKVIDSNGHIVSENQYNYSNN